MISDVAKSLAKAILDGDEAAVDALRDVLLETEDAVKKVRDVRQVNVGDMFPANRLTDWANQKMFFVVVYVGTLDKCKGGLRVGDVIRAVSGHDWKILRISDWSLHGTTDPSGSHVMVVPAHKIPKV